MRYVRVRSVPTVGALPVKPNDFIQTRVAKTKVRISRRVSLTVVEDNGLFISRFYQDRVLRNVHACVSDLSEPGSRACTFCSDRWLR